MCLRAIKTKHYSCSAYLSNVIAQYPGLGPITLTYTINRLFSFRNLRRKGDKFDHRPERPKVLLRHWMESTRRSIHFVSFIPTICLPPGARFISPRACQIIFCRFATPSGSLKCRTRKRRT